MVLLKTDKILIFWSLVILVAIAVPIPPSSPVNQIMSFTDNLDKVVHLILFGVFAWLLNNSFRSRNIKIYTTYFASFLGASIYAGLAEIIQLYIPTRVMSVNDFLAGVVGAMVALFFVYVRDKSQ
jgi:VanZ family protein